MRVIAGTAKGTRLGAAPAGVRPMSDRAREGLFSSLASEVVGARVLDLYAGTGAVGIEALSRGAERALFVDRSRAATQLVARNLERAHLGERALVRTASALSFLKRGPAEVESFDLVFLDPPFELGPPELDGVLAGLASGWLVKSGWTVVLTRGGKSSTPVIPLHWVPARQLRYGDSLITLFREVPWA